MTKPTCYRLFVYGSLRKGFNHPAYSYISRHFDLIGPARVRGLLYDLGVYPAAVPTDTDHFIMGELYQLKNDDEFGWAFAQLDDYEGIHAEPGETPQYKRDIVTVLINNMKSEAWIYWFNRPVEGYPVIPSGDVLLYRQGKNND